MEEAVDEAIETVDLDERVRLSDDRTLMRKFRVSAAISVPGGPPGSAALPPSPRVVLRQHEGTREMSMRRRKR